MSLHPTDPATTPHTPAARVLPDARDPRVQALLPRLTHDDATVRRLALIALSEDEDDALLPWLHWALHDDAPQVRAEAADRLMYHEDPATLQALLGGLTDPAEAVRHAAAHTLAELKSTASAQPLLAALQASLLPSENTTTEHADFVQASLLRALRELREPEALAPALKLAASPSGPVRLEAVGVLGWLKAASAIEVLIDIAQHDAHADVRRAAVGALGMGEAATVLHALRRALEDPVWQVREEAATTLAKLRPSEALPDLLQALQDSHWQVQLRATRALGRLKDPRAAEPIVQGALRHEQANVRKEAALALGEVGNPIALPALHEALHDPDPDVRKSARLAINQITGTN